MTILTKPFSEKNGDKLVVPLVENEQVPEETAPVDVESQRHHRVIIFPARARRVSTSTTLCLLITALAVVSIGIIGGKILYDEYLSVSSRSYEGLRGYHSMPQSSSFQGYAQIPIDDDDFVDDDNLQDVDVQQDSEMEQWTKKWIDLQKSPNRNSFQEKFEIDEDKKYEKIDVPDFRDGRSGRFIHDFNINVTGIIDVTGKRCFVMPLNRKTVLQPKSLFDLIQKMWDGYYKVDTEVVRETMRVVIPPITDIKYVGNYIANECEGMPIYKLEKYVGGVVKRSADLHSEAKFAQFAGKGVTEFDIVNLDEIVAYEKQQNGH